MRIHLNFNGQHVVSKKPEIDAFSAVYRTLTSDLEVDELAYLYGLTDDQLLSLVSTVTTQYRNEYRDWCNDLKGGSAGLEDEEECDDEDGEECGSCPVTTPEPEGFFASITRLASIYSPSDKFQDPRLHMPEMIRLWKENQSEIIGLLKILVDSRSTVPAVQVLLDCAGFGTMDDHVVRGQKAPLQLVKVIDKLKTFADPLDPAAAEAIRGKALAMTYHLTLGG